MALTSPDAIPYPGPTEYYEDADVPLVMAEAILKIQELFGTYNDAVLAIIDAIIPYGICVPYNGNVAPAGWHLCDGTAHGSSRLAALSGSANAPDLRNRFVVGAGDNYNRGNTGGADSVTLTAAQSGIRAHTHPTSVDTKTPAITVKGPGGIATGEETGDELAGTGVQYITSGEGAGAGGDEMTATQASHTHEVSVNNNTAANATSSHENRPPYYALVWIVKI